MPSCPLRGERPAFSAGRREESVRHSQPAAARRASGIRRRPSRGVRPAFSAVPS